MKRVQDIWRLVHPELPVKILPAGSLPDAGIPPLTG